MSFRNKIRLLIYAITIIIVIPSLAVIYLCVHKYRPPLNEIISIEQPEILPDTIKILTWNIGYAGLDKNMDFFYDGGNNVRTTKEKTLYNLSSIISYLQSSNADIILLQEVDINSKRSYGIDEFGIISEFIPDYNSYFVYNFASSFIPVPMRVSMGRVASGLAVFSKFKPAVVMRHSLPDSTVFPKSLFGFNRCVLSCTYSYGKNNFITIYNIHNSAFENDLHREREIEYIKDTVIGLNPYPFIMGGDWNHNPPGYVQAYEERNNKYFRPGILTNNFAEAIFHYDTIHSARYIYEPYSVNTATTLIDFFLVSENIECLEVSTIDLGFEHSDHNPVIITLILKNKDCPKSSLYFLGFS